MRVMSYENCQNSRLSPQPHSMTSCFGLSKRFSTLAFSTFSTTSSTTSTSSSTTSTTASCASSSSSTSVFKISSHEILPPNDNDGSTQKQPQTLTRNRQRHLSNAKSSIAKPFLVMCHFKTRLVSTALRSLLLFCVIVANHYRTSVIGASTITTGTISNADLATPTSIITGSTAAAAPATTDVIATLTVPNIFGDVIINRHGIIGPQLYSPTSSSFLPSSSASSSLSSSSDIHASFLTSNGQHYVPPSSKSSRNFNYHFASYSHDSSSTSTTTDTSYTTDYSTPNYSSGNGSRDVNHRAIIIGNVTDFYRKHKLAGSNQAKLSSSITKSNSSNAHVYLATQLVPNNKIPVQWSTTQPSNLSDLDSSLDSAEDEFDQVKIWNSLVIRLSQLRVLDGLIIFVGGSLSLLTILGNVLVMVAFKIDKNLQTISNYFLLSLAVADFLIGFFSMPLSLIYIVARGWPLGPVACDLWLAIDYLNSNASVLNLLLISFDRYFSVTRPLTYRARRTTRRACTFIAFAWIISALLWPPWIFAWPSIEGRRTVPHYQCYIPFLESNIWVTLITAFMAFWLPVTIMCVLYWRIWRETEKRYRELTSMVVVSSTSQRTPQQQQQQEADNRAKPKLTAHQKMMRRIHSDSCPRIAARLARMSVTSGAMTGPEGSSAAVSATTRALPIELSSADNVPQTTFPCLQHHRYECAVCPEEQGTLPLSRDRAASITEPKIFSTHDYNDEYNLEEMVTFNAAAAVAVAAAASNGNNSNNNGVDQSVKDARSNIAAIADKRKSNSGNAGVKPQTWLVRVMSWITCGMFCMPVKTPPNEPCPACAYQKRLRRKKRRLARLKAKRTARMANTTGNNSVEEATTGRTISGSTAVKSALVGNGICSDLEINNSSNQTSTMVTVHESANNVDRQIRQESIESQSSDNSIYTIVIQLQAQNGAGQEPNATVKMVCNELSANNANTPNGKRNVLANNNNNRAVEQSVTTTVDRPQSTGQTIPKIAQIRRMTAISAVSEESCLDDDDDDDEDEDEDENVDENELMLGSDDEDDLNDLEEMTDDEEEARLGGRSCDDDSDENDDSDSESGNRDNDDDDQSVQLKNCCIKRRSVNKNTATSQQQSQQQQPQSQSQSQPQPQQSTSSSSSRQAGRSSQRQPRQSQRHQASLSDSINAANAAAPSTSASGPAPSSVSTLPMSEQLAMTRVRATIQPKSERKAAKTLSAILLAFIVTWTPYNVLVFVKTISPQSVDSDGVWWQFAYYLCYINSTLNPLCYALCNANFRRTYTRILTCKFRRRNGASGVHHGGGNRRGLTTAAITCKQKQQQQFR